MIDYEITVDVSSADIETKIRVQDAFLKLGYGWYGCNGNGNKYVNLYGTSYTNTYDSGVISEYLMFNHAGRNPTHTVDELLELVKSITPP